jgi:hypothetical protein
VSSGSRRRGCLGGGWIGLKTNQLIRVGKKVFVLARNSKVIFLRVARACHERLITLQCVLSVSMTVSYG